MVLRTNANLSGCRRHTAVGAFALVLASLSLPTVADETPRRTTPEGWETAVESIRVDDLQKHVATLASDAFQGREAGSPGGQAAAAYLMQQLRRLKAVPAGAPGDFVQEFGGGMKNLLACLPGRDATRRDEVIVICGHYDHVGFGTPRNSRGPIGYIHNGADDNASGSAALLELIEAICLLPQAPRRTLLFAWWDGEEKGLLGSKHWISSPTHPLKQIKLVINVDMIGRLGASGLEVFGSRSASGLRQFLSEVNSASLLASSIANSADNEKPLIRLDSDIVPTQSRAASRPLSSHTSTSLRLEFPWEILADSDHHPFLAAKIPAVMLHTGKHEDYHRPTDDVDKLQFEGLQRITRLLLLLTLAAAEREQLPPFRPAVMFETRQQQRQTEESPPPPTPRLGISWKPELTARRIVEVLRVVPGSPADQAGLRPGDRIEQFGGVAVSDFEDFRSLVVVAPRNVSAEIRRPGESRLRRIEIPLAGEPTRVGISWRTDDAEPGVLILTQVLPHSPADRAGLQALDRLLSINGHANLSHEQARRILESTRHPMPIVLERNGFLQTTQLELPPLLK